MSRRIALALVFAGGVLLAGGLWRVSADPSEERRGRSATPAPAPAAAVTAVPNRPVRARGRLDRTFATGGRARTDFGGHVDAAEAVALGPGGTIVVAGWSSVPEEERVAFALSRYLPDGSLDGGFGKGGRVTTDFGAGPPAENMAHDVLVGPDGRITAVGEAGGNFDGGGIGVARYLPDGSPDRSFGGGDGLVMVHQDGDLELCPVARAVAPTAGGGLVLAGSTGCGGESDGGVFMVVVRLTANGALDTSFAHDGIRVIKSGHCAYANAVVVQRDGKIVVAGSDGGCYEERTPFRLVRLNADGSTDTSFGRRGRRPVDVAPGQSGALELAQDSRGRLLVAGTAGGRSAVARLTADGALDKRFGAGGKLLSRSRAIPAAIVPATGGGFVLGGTAFTRGGDTDHGVIGIYDSSGTLERAATVAGTEVNALAVDPEGRLIAAGATREDFAVARLR